MVAKMLPSANDEPRNRRGRAHFLTMAFKVSFLSVLAVAACAETFTIASASPPAGYQLVWSDEFDGASLDTNRWNYWLLGKRRDAVNVTNAVSVGNGQLTIQTYTEGGTHYTGMISTVGRYEFKYGWIEARIAWCDSPGMWSAFWMQSPQMGRFIGDPVNSGTEIDIVEHRKQDKTGADIDGQGVSNIHWDGYGVNHKTAGSPPYGSGLNVGYHIYALEWTPAYQKFYVDDKLMWTFNNTNGLSQHNEFLIFSSEVDNHAWVPPVPADGYGSRTNSTTQMKVNWVRVYQLNPTPPSPPTVSTTTSNGSGGVPAMSPASRSSGQPFLAGLMLKLWRI
jgi:beta-glucanase (GH16 family)